MHNITRRKLLLASTGGLIISLTPFAHATNGADIVASRIWPATAYTRITLESNTPIRYKYFLLSNPNRVVIDIAGEANNEILQKLGQKVLPLDPYINSIRVGQNTPDTVRIVIDLKTAINPQVFTLVPIANFKNRLVIDLYPKIADSDLIQDSNDPLMALLQNYNQNKDSNKNPSQPVTTAKISDKPSPSISNTPIASNTSVPSFNRKPIIMIDPGHGGEDPGATGASGLHEKDVVLSIARSLKKQLDAQGYRTYMTRNEDVFIPLGVRVAKARQIKADVFMSIHADAFTNPAARGTGVYALSPKGATSAAAKYLAQTQNAADDIGGVKYSSDKNVNNTLFDLTQTATINDSLRLGKIMLNHLSQINKLHKGNVDQANFAVLKAPEIPSVLIETAFISNPSEEKLLASAAFREKAASKIAEGVKDYLSTAILARH